jgi:hypothetical protein
VKHRIAIALAVFALVSGVSMALAQDGDPPADPPEVEVPLDEVDESADESDDESDESDADDEADEEAPEAVDASTADNHGAVVSQAAHECPTGPGGVHGECVSAVARDHDQDGTPDHGPGSPGFGEQGNGGGNGNGNGNGRGDD